MKEIQNGVWNLDGDIHMSYLHAYCQASAYGELTGRFGAQLDTRIA